MWTNQGVRDRRRCTVPQSVTWAYEVPAHCVWIKCLDHSCFKLYNESLSMHRYTKTVSSLPEHGAALFFLVIGAIPLSMNSPSLHLHTSSNS